MNIQQLRYPIGEFVAPEQLTDTQRCGHINDIASFPSRVKTEVEGANSTELNWCYRPDGWTVKQVIHHCVDSHMNSLIRFKLALTEDTPTILPYNENLWVNLPDGLTDDLSDSLALLTALHNKWAYLLRHLTPKQLDRSYIHPEHGQHVPLHQAIAMYAWHCNHHLAHITQGLASKGKYN